MPERIVRGEKGRENEETGFSTQEAEISTFPSTEVAVTKAGRAPRSSSLPAMEKAPLSSLAAHRPTTNTSFLPPSCVLHQKPEELKAWEDHPDVSFRAKDLTSLSNPESSEIGL